MPQEKQFRHIIKEKDAVKKEIRGILTHPENFANATGTAFSGADEWVFTETRNLQVFASEYFNPIFPHQPATDVVTLGLAIFFGGVYYIAHLCRIKRSHRLFDYAFVTDRLNRANPNANANHHGMYQSISSELDAIKSIWRELYGDQYDIFFFEDKPGDMSAGKPKLHVTLKNNLAALQPPSALLNNPKSMHWLTWLENTWLAKAAFNVWDFLSKYSMAYWMAWMSIALIFGITTIVGTGFTFGGLVLGIPLLIPVAYNLIRVIRNAFDKRNSNAQQQEKIIEIEKANKRVMKIYFLRKHAHNLHNYLEQQNERNKDELFILTAKLNLNSISYPERDYVYQKSKAEILHIHRNAPEPNYIKKIRASTKKTVFSAITGFFTGYLVTAFNQWPITDFLVVSTLVTVTAMSSLPAAAVMLGIISVMALSYAVYRGIKTTQEIKQKQPVLEEKLKQDDTLNYIKGLEQEITRLKNSIHAKNQHVEHLVKKNNQLINKLENSTVKPLEVKQWQRENHYPHIDNDRFFETLELKPKSSTWAKKFANRAAQWIAGGGSGAFVIRSLLIKGGLIAMFFTVPLPISITAACVLATVYGSVKLYQYHLKKQNEHETNFVEELNIRKESLEHEYKHLIELDNNLQKNCICLNTLREELQSKVQAMKAAKKPQFLIKNQQAYDVRFHKYPIKTKKKLQTEFNTFPILAY